MIPELALATALLAQPADRDWMQPSRSAPSADVRFLRCVIGHESARAGGPRAENPRSTASGLFQVLDSTWASWKRHIPAARRYSHASHAPAATQWEVALWVVRHGGHRAWRGTHCGYGT